MYRRFFNVNTGNVKKIFDVVVESDVGGSEKRFFNFLTFYYFFPEIFN